MSNQFIPSTAPVPAASSSFFSDTSYYCDCFFLFKPSLSRTDFFFVNHLSFIFIFRQAYMYEEGVPPPHQSNNNNNSRACPIDPRPGEFGWNNAVSLSEREARSERSQRPLTRARSRASYYYYSPLASLLFLFALASFACTPPYIYAR